MASFLRPDVVPYECSTDTLRALRRLLKRDGGAAMWVRDKTGRGGFFIAKSPTHALQWMRESSEPDIKRRLDSIKVESPPSSQSHPSEDSDTSANDWGSPPAMPETLLIPDAEPSEDDSEPVRPGGKRKRADDSPPPETTLTVTNKHAARERERRTKLAKELSAAFVDSDEENENPEEAFTRENGLMFAWIGKQPSCKGIGSRAAASMVRKCLAVGGPEAFENWKVVLTHWRAAGSLSISQRPPPGSMSDLSGGHTVDSVLHGFRTAFLATGGVEATGILHDILYRHQLASLYGWYEDAGKILVDNQSVVRARGVGNSSVVKDRLFNVLYPNVGAEDDSYPKLWRHFTRQIEKGRRWWSIRTRLGPGVLALIPSAVVPHSYLERLGSAHFFVWMELIERYNKSAIEFGSLIASPVQDALEGRPPPTRRLVLEEMEECDLRELGGWKLPDLLKSCSQETE
jgi:hypothetical protein